MAEFPKLPAPFHLAATKYRGILLVEEAAVTVGVTSTEVSGGDPERVNMVLINLSPANIYIAPRVVPTTGRGILLGASGGGVVFDAEIDGILTTLQWFGVATAAGSTLYRVTQRRHIDLPD